MHYNETEYKQWNKSSLFKYKFWLSIIAFNKIGNATKIVWDNYTEIWGHDKANLS